MHERVMCMRDQLSYALLYITVHKRRSLQMSLNFMISIKKIA